ncbi:MAG: hypothetical protein J5621_09295 [Paludibacteraceae bacterium]|nr:hypothetical protein [Paludibacteraceae bacterium]
MNKIQPPIITFTPSLGSTATPFSGIVNITQRLCFKSCVGSNPVFAPQFSVRNIANVGKGLYAFTLHCEGIISYVPCEGGCCCTKQQPIVGDVVISVASDTAPTIEIEQGASINALDAVPCQSCSRTFVSDTPLSINVTTTAGA